MVDKLFLLPICWDIETCHPDYRDRWSIENPSVGQCAVTALLYQDIYGGEIYFSENLDHSYNIVEGNKLVDLTQEQFEEEINYDGTPINRNELLENKCVSNRYNLLKSRYQALLKH